jgi:hypothetical protein
MKKQMVRRCSALGVLLLVLLTQPAMAHPTQSFRACTVHVPGMCISSGATFLHGDLVRVKGRVVPAHADSQARVLRQDPGSDGWHRVGLVNISPEGRMSFAWRTRRADAVQNAPYLFKFRILGHGTSNTTNAWVIFGE